jgi:biopolymer transport protein TolR
MAMNTGAATCECAAINITPMIDVLLVLLIIFMAIAPQKSVGLDALVPASQLSSATAPEDPVVLEIAASDAYRINTIPLEKSALADRLRAIYSHRAQRLLFVKADADLEFRTVADAIEIAHGASVDRVALMPR